MNCIEVFQNETITMEYLFLEIFVNARVIK